MRVRAARLLASPTGQVASSVLDQLVSSLSNLVLVVLLARSSTAEQFGRFSIVFSVYVLSLGVVRGLISEPLAVRHGRLDELQGSVDPVGAAIRSTAGVAIPISLALLLPVAMLTDNRAIWLMTALAMTPLMIQDTVRYVFITSGKAEMACLIDGVWLVLTVALSFGVDRTSASSDLQLYGLWLGCGALSGLLGLVAVRRHLAVPFPRWLRDNLPLGWRFTLEFIAQNGAAQLVIIAVGVRGAAEAAAFRGASTILAPLGVVLSGAAAAIIPWLRARLQTGKSGIVPTASALAGAAATLLLLLVPVTYLLPTSIGRSLLGASWMDSRLLLPFLAITSLANSIAFGPQVVLRSLGHAADTLRARVVGAVLLLVVASGALFGGWASGSLAIAMSLPAFAACALLWRAVMQRGRARLPVV